MFHNQTPTKNHLQHKFNVGMFITVFRHGMMELCSLNYCTVYNLPHTTISQSCQQLCLFQLCYVSFNFWLFVLCCQLLLTSEIIENNCNYPDQDYFVHFIIEEILQGCICLSGV